MYRLCLHRLVVNFVLLISLACIVLQIHHNFDGMDDGTTSDGDGDDGTNADATTTTDAMTRGNGKTGATTDDNDNDDAMSGDNGEQSDSGGVEVRAVMLHQQL
jgi:hypothetical protein